MEYENTEIYYFYQVYPCIGDFIYDKTDIKCKKEDNNPDLYAVYPDNPDFMIDKKDICFAGNYGKMLNLYWKVQNSFHKNKTIDRVSPKGSLESMNYYSGKGLNRKYRVFLETEYLEELYEEITIFISANKAITIEAMFPKGCQNQPNKFTCVIPVHYPLVFPFFYMNDVLYMNRIYCCHLERVKIIVAKYTMDYRKYMNCISCACVLKNENWKSDTMFSDIFSEWDRIRILKRIVGYELALEDLMIYRDLEYCNIIHIMEYLYT